MSNRGSPHDRYDPDTLRQQFTLPRECVDAIRAIAVEQGFYWAGKPNMSEAVRFLVDQHTAQHAQAS